MSSVTQGPSIAHILTFSCFRGSQCLICLPLSLLPSLRGLQCSTLSQTFQMRPWTSQLTHRSQFMGEIGLLLLICLLFLPFCLLALYIIPKALLPLIIHFHLPLLHLHPLQLLDKQSVIVDMSVKPTPCTQGHIAQWLEHPVYNQEVLGSNPSLVIF